MVFPVLEKLEIKNCTQLAIAPSHFLILKEFHAKDINHGSTIIANICSRVSAFTSLSIWNVKELTKLSNVLFQNNPNIAFFKLYNCHYLEQLLDFSSRVQIQNCQIVPELNQSYSNVDNINSQDLVGLSSLETSRFPYLRIY